MNANQHTIWKPNPRAKANLFSVLTFSYMFPIFWKNFRSKKKDDDVYEPLQEHTSTTISDKLEIIWKERRKKYKKWALHRALFSVFGVEFIILGFFTLLGEVITVVAPPLFIGKLVSFFTKDQITTTRDEAYLFAGYLISSLFVNRLIIHPVLLGVDHVAMKMRVSCSSLIYRKMLRLSKTALAESSLGQLVNMLSNDVSKFDEGFVLAHFSWVSPVQCALGTYFLYREVGVSAFFGLAFLLSFIPLQIFLGKKMSDLRMKTATRTDERIRLMNEIISGIQVIKMYTWEKPFAKLIAAVRRKEMQSIRAQKFIIGILLSCEGFVTKTSIFISILTFVYMGEELTAERIFVVTAIYNVMKTGITLIFCLSITSLAEVHISLKRIETFLAYEELPHLDDDTAVETKDIVLNGVNGKHNYINPEKRIIFKNVSTKWSNDAIVNSLKEINIDVRKNIVMAVIGPVGSGKSSLLNVILKELPITSGQLTVDGTVSYSSQEPWLFSDNIKNNIIFGSAFNEERYKQVCKACALETDFALFPHGDKTLVGDKGNTLSGGQKARINLARCVYKEADIYLLDDPLSAVDTNVSKVLFEECIQKFLHDKICILSTHQLQYLQTVDKILILKDGAIIGQGTYTELQSSGLDFAKLLEEFEGANTEELATKKKFVRQETVESTVDADDDQDYEQETEHGGIINIKHYFSYIKSGGSYLLTFCLFTTMMFSQTANMGTDYYSAFWVNYEQDVSDHMIANKSTSGLLDRDTVIYIYIGLTASMIFLSIFQTMFFFVFCMRASVNLHNFIFTRISKATMHFYNNNPSGRILNRFSKDVGTMDEYIPGVFYDVVDIFFFLIATITMTSIVDPWLLLPASALMTLFYVGRVICLETSRRLKRKEAGARSLIFGQVTDTMHGLSTIRACKVQTLLINEFDLRQDCHSSSWYMYIASTTSFGFWLDITCVIFISVIIMGLLTLRDGMYGGDMGLIITQYMGLLGVLQWGMRQWSELEVQMTSVERILEYTKLESEPERSKQIEQNLPKNWPEFGRVSFEDISMKYNADGPAVLNKLNFTVNPGEKVGIVGRTGAGKSSIIAALFQLYEIDGSIIIDEVDTTKLPLDALRTKIAIIPQEPVLFSGSMRKNLDPFDEYNDEVLWHALEQVELKEIVAELPSGLTSAVSEGGSNFSVGQRQLVCLARAIIRNNRILVLDEATANVDPHTDGLIQKTIRKQFAHCTVLTIAHRLHTIMDSDKILVMDAGCAVEFDHPHELIKKKGIFNDMVEITGLFTSNNLKNVAEQAFQKKDN